MRVLFYVGDKQWSGPARAVLAAARGLASRGHPVTIACCGDSRLERDARESGAGAGSDGAAGGGGIETIPINSGATAVGGAFDLRRVLAKRFIEAAVVTAERDHLIVGSAMRFAERGGVLRRIPSFEPLDVQRSGRLALKLAAAGLIVSTERELATVNASSDWSIPATVAPLGVDAAAYDTVEPATREEMGASAPGGGLIIACTYDPSGRYRLGTVFRALALLAPRRVNIRVVVFGPGAADDDLRMHAAALGVSPVVSFLGERDDERRLMRAANAGWVVSGGDAAAFACLDFAALRVPVIAERSPLTQHYVAHGISGLLLSPGDPSETASDVASFLTNEEKRVTMGAAGRTRVQRDFTETAMIDGFEQAVNAAGDRTKWSAAAK